jgi:hypothetical protein
VGLACALLVLVPFDRNYPRVDHSSNYAVEDYTRTVLASLEPDALIVSADLEGFVLAAQYLQLVEGVRPDVAVVGSGILAYPWYHAQLETRHPGLLRGLDAERAAYQPLRRRVEQGDTANFAAYTTYSLAFTRIVQGLLRENQSVRPLYVTSDVPPGFFGAFRRCRKGSSYDWPAAIVCRLRYFPTPRPRVRFRRTSPMARASRRRMRRGISTTACTGSPSASPRRAWTSCVGLSPSVPTIRPRLN